MLAICAAWLVPVSGWGGEAASRNSISRRAWGNLPDGQPVDLYRLTNAHGLKTEITNYGAIVVSLWTPDRAGTLADIVLGYETLDEYLAGSPYFGAIVGRYGNRIAQGRFTLDGQQYKLARNNNENHLHGGERGFDKVVWAARGLLNSNGPALVLNYESVDGEEGYPGNLKVRVTYTLTDANELRVRYRASTDKATPVNLTQHSYFNLSAAADQDILDHVLQLNADHYTPVDAGLIPTGEIASVADTPLDFRQPTAIGARIDHDHEQLRRGGGYDHNWVLNAGQRKLRPAATVSERNSGRVLKVLTTEPGIQFYAGNFLDGTNVGKGGDPYQHRTGFCLETQHFPDSPNQANFPSTILRPGETYQTTTVYRFTTQK